MSSWSHTKGSSIVFFIRDAEPNCKEIYSEDSKSVASDEARRTRFAKAKNFKMQFEEEIDNA